MRNSGIEWTDDTWNPIRGCSRISAGCMRCYAEVIAGRFSDPGQAYHSFAERRLRVVGEEDGRLEGRWTGKVAILPRLLTMPLGWRRPRRVFVNSTSDLFHEGLTNDEIAAVYGVMTLAKQHTFQVLTKRARRRREWFAWLEEKVEAHAVEWSGRECSMDIHQARETCAAMYCWDRAKELIATTGAAIESSVWNSEWLDRAHEVEWPLPNVQEGVSVENQAAAEERIPELLRTPAAVRFLSCEPLLGEIDLDLPRCDDPNHGPAEWSVWESDDHATPWCNECDAERSYGHWLHLDGGVDWVIVGCESGIGARACDVNWARSLRDQCEGVGTPIFVKQLEADDSTVEAPADFPDPIVTTNGRRLVAAVMGHPDQHKRVAGRRLISLPYLDGRQHAEFPTAEASK